MVKKESVPVETKWKVDRVLTEEPTIEKVAEEIVSVVKEVVEPKPIVEEKKVKLNLGCGYRKRGEPDWINVDSRGEVKPDMVLDVAKGLPFEDNSIDEVLANDFLEHLMPQDVIFVMEEIYRVLKNGGKFTSLTPSTDGRGWAQDPMHRSFWNANSWLYYTDPDYRGLYGIKAHYRGTVNTFYTNKQLNIIHDHAIMFAIKE